MYVGLSVWYELSNIEVLKYIDNTFLNIKDIQSYTY